MRLIKNLACRMDGELCGCIDYAKIALEYQYDKPALAKVAFQIAQTEYQHYQMLHEQTVQLINEIKEQGRTIPQSMSDKWEIKHNKLIAKAAKAQTYMSMFK